MSGDYSIAQSTTSQELALSNALILECLFKYCSAKELSQYRLVNKLWHCVSLPFWVKLAGPITLYEHARDAVFEKNKHMTLSYFVDMYRKRLNKHDLSISGWPYHKFKLMFFRDLSYDSSNSAMGKFWLECGPWINELQLFGGRLHEYAVYKNLILCKFTPNVKNLKFCCQFDGVREQTVSDGVTGKNLNLKSLTFLYCMPKIEWEELFSHFPNLTHFEISSPYRLPNWENELIKMMNCIKTLRSNDKTVLPLKSMNIHVTGVDQNPTGDNPIRIGELFKNANLLLESLSVDAHVFRGEANANQLDNLLTFCQPSLKRLKIRDSLGESHINFPTVVMNALKELTLIGKSFKGISILKFTPNLTLLHVINPWKSRSMDSYMLKGFVRSREYLGLEFLRDLRYDFDCTPRNMFSLVCWLPNVEKLEMPLTNETFRIACKHWRKLKHLVVQKDRLDDDGICGVASKSELRTTSRSNILDLKDLRSFVMENHRHNNSQELEAAISPNDMLPTKLTEKSILHGFLKLPRLQTLSVTMERETVSPQLLESLKMRIGEVKVVQMNHPYRYRQH